MWRRYGLGYCEGGCPELDEVDALLGRQRGSSAYLFRRRLIFPLFDHLGRVIGFAGRILAGDDAKYRNSPESAIFHKGDRVYGLTDACKDAIQERGRAVVVEGYTDVMRAQTAGLAETVCSMGTALTHVQVEVLSRYTKTIVTLFDGDDAGRQATGKASQVIAETGVRHVPAALPDGLDPDEYIVRYGIAPLVPYLDDLIRAANGE